ncbi:MAG: hypothetical protein AB7K52_04290 [Phycisphaerales bacterium]
MPNDYIPRPDAAFAAYAGQFVPRADQFLDSRGLAPELLDAMLAASAAWSAAWPAHVSAQAAAQAARQSKDQARAALEAVMRAVAAVIQTYPGTTDADRAMIGLTVADGVRTRAATPTSAPRVLVESGQRLTHTLRISDESTPTRTAKPPGTAGAEVWLALAEPNAPAPPPPSAPPPAAPASAGGGDPYRFVALSSRGRVQTGFTSADAGKTAYYALRWVSTRGEKGPWSEVTSATVAA